MKVVKFGGSSLASDENLRKAALKIIQFLKEGQKVVAILSAQGKTTDTLLDDAKKLSNHPNKRVIKDVPGAGQRSRGAERNQSGYRERKYMRRNRYEWCG